MISHSWYKDLPINKSHDIIVSLLQAFVITKDKNGKQIFTIVGISIINLPIDRSNISVITKAARAIR